jgi:hypothetical protein
MRSDGFTTEHLCIAAFLSYVFGEESLVQITFDDKQRATFHFHAASLAAIEYTNEFHAGNLAIADLSSFWEHQTSISRRLRLVRRNNQTTWEREEFSVQPDSGPSRPESFWESARQATEVRRRERDERERERTSSVRHVSKRQ